MECLDTTVFSLLLQIGGLQVYIYKEWATLQPKVNFNKIEVRMARRRQFFIDFETDRMVYEFHKKLVAALVPPCPS